MENRVQGTAKSFNKDLNRIAKAAKKRAKKEQKRKSKEMKLATKDARRARRLATLKTVGRVSGQIFQFASSFFLPRTPRL